MKGAKITRWIAIVLGLVGVTALTVAISFPFLAINAPSGSSVAVVEGWIDPVHIPQVAQVLKDGGYERIYITGTPRNFSYTLRYADTLVLRLQRPVAGTLTLNACGGKNAGMAVYAGERALLTVPVNDSCFDRNVALDEPTDLLRITPTFPGVPDPSWELLFLLYGRIDGVNIHALQRTVHLHLANGEQRPGTPSFADACALALVQEGIPMERIQRLPTVMLGESRTWANAQRFAEVAMQGKMERVDVISFGIHARRSRLAYSTACGGKVAVGVRCIEDPELQRGRWWRSWTGWKKVIRELAGVPTSYLVDPVRRSLP